MKLNLHINRLKEMEDQVEIVERKGLGHPDTICDLIVDYLSIRLSQIYKKKFGTIPHFNIDKALLAAGSAEYKFGGGKIISPMKFYIGDRATYKVGKKKINLNKVIKDEIYKFLKSKLRFLNRKNFIVYNEIKPGSSSLQDIFKRKAKILPSNDTSALVGYAPLTTLETIVLKVEQFLNSLALKKRHPEVGEDIKIMGRREGKKYYLTIAIAFVDRFIKNEDDYFSKKAKVEEEINKFIAKNFQVSLKIVLNTLDRRGAGVDGCYLCVTGTCADSGDSGQVGRGNRANGLIPLNRVAGSEAAAGKNCVSHVGKIYNLLSFKLADEIYRKTGKKTTVWLVSQIGQPVDQPALVSIGIEKINLADRKKAEKIVKQNFSQMNHFINLLITGKYRVV
ncbi:S-adenosylmethionine synthetase [Candidatus Roizmanbacteria bacterium CG_4_10_14_0_8_um_filter_36_36]|nr:MAG: S-adenosylmethionine synthetase [Candidatus Roizmanbacteria bacterium CG03_land_8_20_14_0_80_36_21]PIY69732.1 MAG: S-adenosylmethionine synthetase [Candidatus Roizmanbacteria bacterium CG_4_10_14_0_8_um_filter_36_36]PJA52785.1 MAG: S-adenosylmethionine synthetase [Candidatus Roizmanbacteria bacterium CG_4_9_14_3_um_filter_36_11]